MTYYKILLLNIFISVTICSPTSSNDTINQIRGCTTSNHIDNDNSAVSSDIVKNKVKIDVYYESLCPFSVKFFVTQLKPAVQGLGSHLDIHLIPYGHAETRRVAGRYKFWCQHGNPECFGNAVQACAIDVMRNTIRAVYFNTCLMQYTSYYDDYQHFQTVFNWCGYQEKADVKEIWNCVNSSRGPNLLKRYGDETHALAPPYVPYLMIDDSSEHQDEATDHLITTVCQMLRPKPKLNKLDELPKAPMEFSVHVGTFPHVSVAAPRAWRYRRLGTLAKLLHILYSYL